jgi:hypothetical protein
MRKITIILVLAATIVDMSARAMSVAELLAIPLTPAPNINIEDCGLSR